MKKMRPKEFWEQQDVLAKNKILLEVSNLCLNSIQSIRGWFLEYRIPQNLYRNIISNYIKDNFDVEILWGGGN